MTAKGADWLALLRVRQWTKNLVVFTAVVFADLLSSLPMVGRACLAFAVFCLASSALYAVNDVLDAERDRAHPTKRDRPVASGTISPTAAIVLAAGLGILALGMAWLLGRSFVLVLLAYWLIQAAYIAGLKDVLFVDVITIAIGFVLRGVGGVVAVGAPESPWLLLGAGLLMLFLATAKRRHELSTLGEAAAQHRPVLARYSIPLLDNVLNTLSAATITMYALYTFFASNTERSGYAMMLTIPFVLYGLLRYQYLVFHRGEGGSPEEVLLTDLPLVGDIGLWLGTVLLIHYVRL